MLQLSGIVRPIISGGGLVERACVPDEQHTYHFACGVWLPASVSVFLLAHATPRVTCSQDLFSKLFASKKFWKRTQHASVDVRIAMYNAVQKVVINSPDSLAPHLAAASPAVLVTIGTYFSDAIKRGC